MAVGVDTIKTVGRLVFELARDGETTSRNIDIPYPVTDETQAQSAINNINADFVGGVIIQPANWRDEDVDENNWTTTAVRYEIVTTATTPITPE